jgi:hypothetical protein
MEVSDETLTYLEHKKLVKKLRKLLKVVEQVEHLATRVELESHCAHMLRLISNNAGLNYENKTTNSTK